MDDTELSKAALSTQLKTLIGQSQVTTTVDGSSRPPKTIYALDERAKHFWTSKPLTSKQKAEPEKLKAIVTGFSEIAQFVIKQPGKLSELLRLAVLHSVWYGEHLNVAIPSDGDIDVASFHPLPDLELTNITVKDADELCINQLVNRTKYWLKTMYNLEMPELEQQIRQEIEKLRQESFFDVGQKSLFGIRIKKKLAVYCTNPAQNWDEIESETGEITLSSLHKIKAKTSLNDDLFRLLLEAQTLSHSQKQRIEAHKK